MLMHNRAGHSTPDRLEVKQADCTSSGECTASGVLLATMLGQPCRLQCAGLATPETASLRECWSACMTPAGVQTRSGSCRLDAVLSGS